MEKGELNDWGIRNGVDFGHYDRAQKWLEECLIYINLLEEELKDAKVRVAKAEERARRVERTTTPSKISL